MTPLNEQLNGGNPAGEMPRGKRGIAFDDWSLDIVRAADYDQIMNVMRAYLAAWSPEQLRQLPVDVSTLMIESIDDVIARAVLASRAEINASAGCDTRLLREMALTFAAASTRLRWLRANLALKI